MKKMQKKARQDNKGGKDLENDEKKLNVKEEEQSKYSVYPLCFSLQCLARFVLHACIVI